MPRIKNWEEWDEDSEDRLDPARKIKKPVRYDRDEERTEKKRTPKRPPAPALPLTAPEPAPQVTPPAPAPPPPTRQGPALPSSRQLAQAFERSGGSPRQVYKMVKQGVSVARIAGVLGIAPEMVQEMVKREQAINQATRPALEAVKLHESGQGFPQIGEKLGVSEAEAKLLYARGHVQRYGSNPAVQYGRKEGKPFPTDIFGQPNYLSETNRNSLAISNLIGSLRGQLEPHGYGISTDFEADTLGGRHVVKVVKGEETVGQPFRLTATPSGVPLVSKTGKASGGYRLTTQGQSTPLDQRLAQAALEMAENDWAYKAKQAARNAAPPQPDDDGPISDSPDWMNQAPLDNYQDEGGYSTAASNQDEPDWLKSAPLPGEAVTLSPAELASVPDGNPKRLFNVVDIMDVAARRDPRNELTWRQISGGDYTRMSQGGQFREENSESKVKDQHGQWAYPPELAGGRNYRPNQSYYDQGETYPSLTPVMSKGTVYPLEARYYIPGNVELEDGRHWGSQAKQGKQMKRDELSLTRKYWQAGPALGVAYPETPQHILGQRATEPETAHIARAFILDRGGIIPEGQMWKDTSYAPWVFGSFEQSPEKHQMMVDANYSDEEVLRAAGLLGPDGKFKPRVLRNGDRVASPNGFKKDLLGNNEAGVISDYEIAETTNVRGAAVKALRFKGYFGNRPNVASAMKMEGWKNLAQDKHIRQDMGLDYDLIMNKPSDAVVANISMLNALPRQEFEGLWGEVHGDRPAPTRTASMTDVEDLAKVWQRYQEKNRATEILPGRVFDGDTLKHYLQAGIIKDDKYTELPPLFEGAEPQYKADLMATGFKAPVRVKYITDVTNLRRGHLSNEILRSVETNFSRLGEHLRDLGYEGRDIYNTLFEMHQLNTKPGFSEVGSPVVDLIGDLTGNKEARAGMESLYAQRLAEILPESMRSMDPRDYTPEQKKAYQYKFQNEAASQAMQQYYTDQLGTDSYIFRLGSDKEASYMVNPGMVERFGFIEEESNERISALKDEGDDQLQGVWRAAHSNKPGALPGMLKSLPGRMKPIIRNQEQLLTSVGARKKWFGTSDTSFQTHVHASDYALPRNSMAKNWEDIFYMTGLKRNKANRAYLNRLSRAGNLPFSGIRNPASSPIAQTGTILNMLTPDILQAAGLDIPLTGHPDVFHPHQVQAQGGDNDSDQSQVYMVMKQMAGELVNAFGLKPTDPALITQRAQAHAAGEYTDAVKKLNLLDPQELAGMSHLERVAARRRQAATNLMGFDPTQPVVQLAGSAYTSEEWRDQSLKDYQVNSRQIGQAYNVPIRVGINLTDNPAAKGLVSEYGGWMYQNPLDKANYPAGSPEDDLFSFFSSFDAMTGSFSDSNFDNGLYYSFRKKKAPGKIKPGQVNSGFENRGQFGAAGLLAILKRLTGERSGTQAQMTEEQMAAMMTRSTGDMAQTAGFVGSQWNLPGWNKLNSNAIKDLEPTEAQTRMLQGFATGDSPMAQMMRGYAVRNGIKGAARMQRLLSEDMQDPAKWQGEGSSNSTKFKGDLRNYVNVLQNELYDYGRADSSPEFKRDYEQFNASFGKPNNTNWFSSLEPGNKDKGVAAGEFYSWPVEKRQDFYGQVAGLLQKHVTGYDRDEAGNFRNMDPGVSRNNPMFKDWYPDYDRIKDMMAVNAREQEGDNIEGFAPTLKELEQSEVTGPLVREKHTRKRRMVGGLSKLFEVYRGLTGHNGQTEAGVDFENFVAGKKPYTDQETEMLRQAELGHQAAQQLRLQRLGYKEDEPLYFAEGGVLDRPTKLGETRGGRDIIGGEAGREYVVPEGKTQDLGGGLKLFDEDELGPGAPQGPSTLPGVAGQAQVRLAKGGVLDYATYANVPTQDFDQAMIQAAYDLSGGSFSGDAQVAQVVVKQRIEADIQQMAANPPVGANKGLYATDIEPRTTDIVAQALGPNPAAHDFSAWNDLLGQYGLSADLAEVQPNSSQVHPAIKKRLFNQAGGDKTAYGGLLNQEMAGWSAKLQGKQFSHANYGHVYDSIPGWAGFWNGKRPGATKPTTSLTATAQANLARLVGTTPPAGGGSPPSVGTPGAAAAPGTPGVPALGQASVISFTQPFSGKYVEQLDTVVRGLGDPALRTDVIQAAGSGTMLPNLGPEQKGFIEAASGVQTSYQKELARAQRVIEKFENQEESRAVRRLLKDSAGGRSPLTPDEEQLLTDRQGELTAHRKGLADIGMTQRIPETEYLYAKQVKDLLTSSALGGVVGERDLTQTGEDAQKLLARENYKGSFMSSAGAKYTVDPQTVQAIQSAALIKARSTVAKPQLDAARQAESQGLRLAQLDQREDDQSSWFAAIDQGRKKAFSDPVGQDMYNVAQEVKTLSADRQAAFQQALPLKQGYHAALASGDVRGAQRYFDALQPLTDQLGGLKDQLGALTPHVKEHVEALGFSTAAIREEIKERKAAYSTLTTRADTLRSQAIGLSADDKKARLDEADRIETGVLSPLRNEIKQRARLLGQQELEKQQLTDMIHEPQGRAITGLGQRPQTRSEMAGAELRKGYDPQRMFWQFQNMQQLQYMAFMPMLGMRDQYLGEQSSMGQAQYALGAGQMPASVLSALGSQANMSRASSSFGRGVDKSMAMNAWKGFTGFLAGNEGSGSFLGAAGFDLTSALAASMGLKMVAGPAVSAIGKLAGGLGTTTPASYYLPAGGSGVAPSLGGLAGLGSRAGQFAGGVGAAALTGGGVLAGGLGLGLGAGIYQAVRPEGSASLSEFATTAAYGLGGMDVRAEDMATVGSTWIARMAQKAFSGQPLWDQEKANAWGQGVGNYTGAVTEPVPAWVTKIEGAVAKILGTKELPFDRAELAQMVQMAAEDQGISKKQLEQSPGVAEKLAAEISDSYTSGVSMSQRSSLRQRAIDVSGYAPGTEGARMMSEWVQQGSQFERQQRLQSASMVQGLADMMDFTPQQRRDMSQKVYDLLSAGVSQNQVGRSMQQRAMNNQYYWSAAAYEAGQPEMSMMDRDKPWMPKNQEATWAIEDRRRGEDNARELGTVTMGAGGFQWQGGRQEVELGWQRQKLDQEQEYWDFRRQSQVDDFAMQQKMFDFNIRQQRLAMEWEEKQSRTQANNYEKQYQLNKKIFELQTGYQRQDFDKQQGRMDTQWAWQQEDMSWNREGFNIQSGWEMEDLQRSLRYASNGRERMDIRRQIERQSVMNERQTTEFDRAEGRAGTEHSWAQEDLNTQRQRFEEMNELQRQQMELGREYWLEQQSMASEYREARRAMMEEQIILQTQQNNLTVQQFNDGMAFTDAQHALDTEINETKHQWALDDLELARQRSKEDEIILGWQRETTSASYFYAFYQAMGYDAAVKARPELEAMATAANDMANDTERYARAMANGQDVWANLPTPSNPAGPAAPVQSPDPNALPDAPMTPIPNNVPLPGMPGVPYSEYTPPLPGSGGLGAQSDSGSADMVTLLAAILTQLQEGGGTIILDEEKLKRAGFLHQSNFDQVYR